MTEKQALGKGLSALINDAASSLKTSGVHHSNGSNGSPLLVPLSVIAFNPDQPRKNINQKEIDELSESIKKYGLLQPIIVTNYSSSDDNEAKSDIFKYQIVAGERRFHAAKKAGLLEVPIILKKIGSRESFEIAVIENIQRQNLTPLEEGMAYQRLINDYNHTQESLANVIAKSRSYIANTMRLLKLPEEIKEMILNGQLSSSHARAIVNVDNPLAVAKQIIAKNMTVREVESFIREISTSDDSSKKIKQNNDKIETANQEILANLANVQKMLLKQLQMKVQIKSKKDKYKIIIDCEDNEDLDTIISKLSGDVLTY